MDTETIISLIAGIKLCVWGFEIKNVKENPINSVNAADIVKKPITPFSILATASKSFRPI